jgi:hypothetical protein
MRAATSTGTIRALMRAHDEAIAAGTTAAERGVLFSDRSLSNAEAAERRQRQAVSDAERGLGDAQRALSSCQAADPPCDCSGPAAEVAAATRRLDKARTRLSDIRRAVSQMRAAQDEFRSAVRAAESFFNGHARSGLREASALAGTLDEYTSNADGRVDAAGNGSGGGQGVDGAAGEAGAPIDGTGCELVELGLIDDSDSPVSGPDSFRESFSYGDALWATEEMEDRMLPAVRAGHGRDYFTERDRAEGRRGDRSYARLYDTWFGDDHAIKLSRNADGLFGVANGYHRLYVARQLDLPAVPARVRR